MKRSMLGLLLITTVSKANQSQNNEWNAQHYHQNSSLQFQKGSAIINNWSFAGTENILDIGCGNGALTAEIAKKTTGSVLGTDASESMIAFSRQNHCAPNLSFNTVSASELSFDQTFDLAFSFNCLHWVQDKQAVFDNVFKALKPGGKFVFILTIKSSGRENTMIAIGNKIKSEPYWQNYFPSDHTWPWYHETQTTIEEMLAKSGLRVIEQKSFWNHGEFPSKEKMIGHVLALSCLNPLSKENQEKFAQELIDRYLETRNNSLTYETYQMYAIVEKPRC